MKKVIYLALAALICSCTGNSYTVSGTIEGVKAGDSIMIFSMYDSTIELPLAATAVGEDGTFTLEGTADAPCVAALVLNNQSMISQLIIEKGDIAVSLNEQGAIKIEGTPLNDAMAQFTAAAAAIEQRYMTIDENLSTEEKIAAQEAIFGEYTDLVSSTITSNLDNLVGASLFVSEEFSQMEPSAALERLNSFSPELLEQEFMVQAASAINGMLQTETGKQYIDIALTSIDGKQTSVSELLAAGKYVLIDFWATWCGPCVAELPHLKAAYAKYKNKGFEIYGISLDRDEDAWRKMVDKTMPWINVIDTPEVNAADKYAVRTIPTNLLVAPSGEIIAKNLRGEQLEETLAETLK